MSPLHEYLSRPTEIEAMSFLRDRIIIESIGCILDRNPDGLDLNLSFPQHGGNSLSAVALASLCKRQGVTIPIGTILRSQSLKELLTSPPFFRDHGNWSQSQWLEKARSKTYRGLLHQCAPTSADHVSSVSNVISTPQTKSELDLFDNTTTRVSIDNSIHRKESFVENPAAHIQLLMIRDSVKESGTNIVRYYETYKSEDISIIKAAWDTLFHQEAILRFRYSADFEPQSHTYFDWTEITTTDPVQFDAWVHAPIASSDIRSAWQAITLNPSDRTQCISKSTVIWTVHHALIDGYSAKLLLHKLRTLAAGKSVSAGPPYMEVVEAIQTLNHSKQLEGEPFWNQQNELYENSVVNLQLPPPLGVQRTCGTSEYFIPLGTNSQIVQKISRECSATPAAIFYSAWAVILTVLTDSQNVVFGTAVLGRNLPLAGIEDVIGPLFTTPPFAISVGEDYTLREFISKVFNTITDLTEYQWTIPKHILSRGVQSALFIGFEFDTLAGDYPIRPIEPPFWKHESALPLTIMVGPEATCFQYKSEEFKGASTDQICQLFDRIVRSFIRLDLSICSLREHLVGPEAGLALKCHGNLFSPLTRQFSVSDDLVTLFERVVSQHPEAIAVSIGEKQFTYSELDNQIGIIANTLKQTSKKREIICVEAIRSVSWIVGIFAVMKVGAIYCPLDPELPEETQAFIVRNTCATTLLCESVNSSFGTLQSRFQHLIGINSILAQSHADEGEEFPRRAFPDPSTPAYVCYTSGSTGTPKGVICSHEGLVAFQSDLKVRLFAQQGKRVSQIMSPAFDGSIHEIFSTLCYGATLVLPADDNVFEALNTADSAIMTPSVAEVLDPYDYPQLKHVYLVGEQVKQSLNDRWATAKETYNMYGPTEGTCGATISHLQPGKPVTIGRPNPTTRLYILDSRCRSVPVGVVGEIHIAGIQVARGYLGMTEATTKRFTADPFCQETRERMFKTGDRGYWTEDGEVVCLGRNDRQIKLRGYRLDLDDLEIRASRAVEGIKSVAMAVRRDHLVAAIQPCTLDRHVIVAAFAKALPGYAQPRDIILTDKFPTTRAGKLDYRKIVSSSSKEVVHHVDSLTPMEIVVAQAWREVINLKDTEKVGPESNFLQLGGSSLLQMTLLAKVSTVLGKKVPLRLIINSHSLRDLATHLENLPPKVGSPNTVHSPILGLHKLSPLEKDWWSKYNLTPKVNTQSFNVSSVFHLEPNSVNLPLLEKAWNAVLSRYTIFRSRYMKMEGGDNDVERRYTENPPRVELSENIDIKREVNRMFDLEKESPIRVVLTQCKVMIVASHIVADLQTLQILFRDVEAIYHGRVLSHVEHAYELQAALERENISCELEFWSQYLKGGIPSRDGKVKPPSRKSFDGNSRLYQLAQPLTERLLRQSKGEDYLSLQQLAIAAVALVMESKKEETDIVLGTPFANRSTDAQREIVGLFLQPLPVRVQHTVLDSHINAKPYLNEVCRSATAALAHAVSWHDLLEHLHIVPNYPDNPIFDVMVTFHTPDIVANLKLPGLVPCLSWADGSKFLLLIEFTALDTGDIVLRAEYDTDHHSVAEIDTLVANIATALSMLLSDLPCNEIKRKIRAGEVGMAMTTFKGDLMGVPLKMYQVV